MRGRAERAEGPRRDRPDDITAALGRWGRGDRAAAETVFRQLYDQLHRAASQRFADERGGHTLQTTALVNEAFIRLDRQAALSWRSRAHFLAFATRVMRQVLIDHARKHCRQKRGGRPKKVVLADAVPNRRTSPEGMLELHDALERLAALDARKADIVELRCFGGLSNEQVAEVLGLSRSTVVRHLRLARAWLFDRLRGVAGDRGRAEERPGQRSAPP